MTTGKIDINKIVIGVLGTILLSYGSYNEYEKANRGPIDENNIKEIVNSEYFQLKMAKVIEEKIDEEKIDEKETTNSSLRFLISKEAGVEPEEVAKRIGAVIRFFDGLLKMHVDLLSWIKRRVMWVPSGIVKNRHNGELQYDDFGTLRNFDEYEIKEHTQIPYYYKRLPNGRSKLHPTY